MRSIEKEEQDMKIKMLYKVQKYIRGWGWSTISITPLKEQAEEAVEILRARGIRARVEEEQA